MTLREHQLLSLFMIMAPIILFINNDFGCIFVGTYLVLNTSYDLIKDYRYYRKKKVVPTKEKPCGWFNLCIYGIIPAICLGPVAVVFWYALYFTILCLVFFGSSYMLYEKRLEKKQTK